MSNKKEYQKLKGVETNIERRSLKGLVRMNADSRSVEGVAAIIGQKYDMGWYEEVIEVGAFDNALKTSDIRCLFNHDANQLLARTSSKTLTVWVEGKELRYKFDAPKTRDDIIEMLERGDLQESSFQFRIKEQRWVETQQGDDWNYVRHIDEFEILYDVAPVTFPANPSTSVAKRSFDAFKNEQPKPTNNIPLSLHERELNTL